MKKSVEDKIVAVGLLIFGIALIVLGIFLKERIIATVALTICGTIFDVYALQFLSKKGK